MDILDSWSVRLCSVLQPDFSSAKPEPTLDDKDEIAYPAPNSRLLPHSLLSKTHTKGTKFDFKTSKPAEWMYFPDENLQRIQRSEPGASTSTRTSPSRSFLTVTSLLPLGLQRGRSERR